MMSPEEINKAWEDRWDTSYCNPESKIYKFWKEKKKCEKCGEQRVQAYCHNGCHFKGKIKENLETEVSSKKDELKFPQSLYLTSPDSNSHCMRCGNLKVK